VQCIVLYSSDLILYFSEISWKTLATKTEHPERKQWWLNELDSLGISPEKINQIDDHKEEEVRSLTEDIKQALYQEYKAAYS
jgi:hypothetical protein